MALPEKERGAVRVAQIFKASRSVIETLPPFYQAAYAVLEREGLVEVEEEAGNQPQKPTNKKAKNDYPGGNLA